MRVALPALPDIDEVDARSEVDDACFAELREVLVRHNALDRFGITLLHQHFDTAEDELLVEEVDVESRTLTIRPVSRGEVVGRGVKETNWRLDSDAAVSACTPYQFCYVDSKNDHHRRSGHKE
jgi:hypothetical protein